MISDSKFTFNVLHLILWTSIYFEESFAVWQDYFLPLFFTSWIMNPRHAKPCQDHKQSNCSCSIQTRHLPEPNQTIVYSTVTVIMNIVKLQTIVFCIPVNELCQWTPSFICCVNFLALHSTLFMQLLYSLNKDNNWLDNDGNMRFVTGLVDNPGCPLRWGVASLTESLQISYCPPLCEASGDSQRDWGELAGRQEHDTFQTEPPERISKRRTSDFTCDI